MGSRMSRPRLRRHLTIFYGTEIRTFYWNVSLDIITYFLRYHMKLILEQLSCAHCSSNRLCYHAAQDGLFIFRKAILVSVNIAIFADSQSERRCSSYPDR